MKKALIFIGLILFAGAIIYSTNFIGGGDDNVEEEFGPKRSKEELFLIEKINNIENIEWSKDSIDNLKMSIQISKNFKKISKKAQDDLLSHLENIESKTLQNSFNKWISTSCGSFINSNISQRIHQLSSKRPSDTQLKKYKQGLNSYRLKNQIEREYDELLSIEYNENKKNEIDRLIRNHLNQKTIKNCFVIQKLRNRLEKGINDFFNFQRAYIFQTQEEKDIDMFNLFYIRHKIEFDTYGWYNDDYERIKKEGFTEP